jgi:DNA repair protein RadC
MVHRSLSVSKTPLGLVDIRILDHIIVAGSDTISFAESGLL